MNPRIKKSRSSFRGNEYDRQRSRPDPAIANVCERGRAGPENRPLFPFVQETAQFALSGSNVSCQFDVSRDLWTCNFDKNQIGQVIDNIIINAQQAMPVGGTIEVSAQNTTLRKKNIRFRKGKVRENFNQRQRHRHSQRNSRPRIFDRFIPRKRKVTASALLRAIQLSIGTAAALTWNRNRARAALSTCICQLRRNPFPPPGRSGGKVQRKRDLFNPG